MIYLPIEERAIELLLCKKSSEKLSVSEVIEWAENNWGEVINDLVCDDCDWAYNLPVSAINERSILNSKKSEIIEKFTKLLSGK